MKKKEHAVVRYYTSAAVKFQGNTFFLRFTFIYLAIQSTFGVISLSSFLRDKLTCPAIWTSWELEGYGLHLRTTNCVLDCWPLFSRQSRPGPPRSVPISSAYVIFRRRVTLKSGVWYRLMAASYSWLRRIKMGRIAYGTRT